MCKWDIKQEPKTDVHPTNDLRMILIKSRGEEELQGGLRVKQSNFIRPQKEDPALDYKWIIDLGQIRGPFGKRSILMEYSMMGHFTFHGSSVDGMACEGKK